MADMSREQERAELYKAIWGIANDLRGSVDGWDFKQYVLGAMFYRYISENLTEYINNGERKPEMLILIMHRCLMRMQQKQEMVLSKKKVSSYIRLSYSVT